ncbi:hypothetical protein U1Q18_026596 [Sarracenia purpurea var. burkii]
MQRGGARWSALCVRAMALDDKGVGVCAGKRHQRRDAHVDDLRVGAKVRLFLLSLVLYRRRISSAIFYSSKQTESYPH